MLSFCHKVTSNGKLSHDAGYIKKKKSKGNPKKMNIRWETDQK
jgi:hypothetical protein